MALRHVAQGLAMQIENIPLSDLVPYEKNARKHPVKQVELLSENIARFGFTTPILIDENNNVIAGHGRLEALKRLDWGEAPCVRMEGLTEEEVKALRLADNQIAQMGEWDTQLVIEELKELPEVLVELTGFDKDLLLTHDSKDEDVPDVPEVPRSVVGDIYQLGRHRVLCGDSTALEAVESLMDGVKADMLLTDPPYNVDYTGKTKDALKIQNDLKGEEAFVAFLTDSFVSANAYMKAGAVWYIWQGDMQGHNFVQAVKRLGEWHVAQQLVWNKNSMVLSRQDYHWKHELCLYGWKDGAAHLWNADRTQTTILNFDRPSRSESHPTMKPVDLLVYQMTNNTKGEDIVLDTFLGSGSTLIAAEKTGRTCYGIELDPKYVDVVVQRYVDYTGNKSVIKNGEEIVWTA